MKIFGYYFNVVELIIAINFLAFILTLIMPKFMISNFGLVPVAFVEKPWTLITSIFLHGSFDHIFANMITLFFFGFYLHSLIGEREFLKIYFLGGLAGSFLYLVLNYSSSIPAIGASGAIFSVGAALAVLRPNQPVLLFFFIPMRLWTAIFLGFIILSFIPGVAWQGHLGGLIIGLIFGNMLKEKSREVYIIREF